MRDKDYNERKMKAHMNQQVSKTREIEKTLWSR